MTPPPFAARRGPFPVETLRGAAILLVVLYHVLGSSPDSGLRLAAGTPARGLALLLDQVHMPVFAMLAGVVYGLAPPRGGLGPFLRGKLRRLAVPGLIAALVFIALTRIVSTGFEAPPLWLLPVMPYAHFWFLQAILVVFAVVALADRLAGTGGVAAVFAATLIGLMTGLRVDSPVLAVNGALRLAPFFAFGVLIWRGRAEVLRHRLPLVLAAGAVAAAALAVDLEALRQTGALVGGHGAPLHVALALALCLFGMVAVPDLQALEWLGPPAFAIYLYHPLATSAARRGLALAGVPPEPGYLLPHIVAGLVAGVVLPLLIYLAATRHPLGRRLVLGLRR